jgi:predicted dehydrogenase
LSARLKIALVGAGLIGQRHAESMRVLGDDISIASVVDPSGDGQIYAQSLGVDWYPSLRDMFASSSPDGAILATPNQVHVENGLDCVAERCPILLEKPIATSCEEARKLVDAARAEKVPVLVGHHRRHNPLIQKARLLIDEGRLGRITSVHGTCWLLKPENYFEPEWRRKKGAGPILVNAIHDIDLLRYLCGDVESVRAISSNAVRGFETEDTAAVLMRFEAGALGTFSLSDTVASPWSWEITAGENPAYASTPQSCYMIGGTEGSLSVPDMRLWRHEGEGHWKQPISATSFPELKTDPLVAQMRNFVNVIRGSEPPLVSGEEGLMSLAVVEAIKKSAESGETIRPLGAITSER